MPGDSHAVDEVIHAIEAAQEGRFAAAAGTNECRHQVLPHGHRDAFERLAGTVVELHVTCLDSSGHRGDVFSAEDRIGKSGHEKKRSVPGAHRLAHPGAGENGDGIQGKSEQQEHEHRGIQNWARFFDVRRLSGQHIDVVTQIHELMRE